MTETPNHPVDYAIQWANEGHGVALATVIRTWGSAPRPAGSQLVVRDDGAFEGSVSGGCIEGAVIVDAEEVIATGRMKELEFGVSDEQAFDVGLACGGRVSVLVQAVAGKGAPAEALDQLIRLSDLREQRAAALSLFDLQTGETAVLSLDEDDLRFAGIDLAAASAACRRTDRPMVLEEAGKRLFVNIHNPPLKLVLIGAVHIAQALAPMARAAGYDVTVIDPRGAFATTARFADVRLVEDWPDDVLAAERPDQRTAVVTLTHDPKLDDAALIQTLGTTAFYIGSLGSRKTHKARLERLSALGFDNSTLNRICGPVGFAIGARSPAEIAVSIMAEITQYLRMDPASRSDSI